MGQKRLRTTGLDYPLRFLVTSLCVFFGNINVCISSLLFNIDIAHTFSNQPTIFNICPKNSILGRFQFVLGFLTPSLTPWRLGGFGDFRKKKQQFLVALPTP